MIYELYWMNKFYNIYKYKILNFPRFQIALIDILIILKTDIFFMIDRFYNIFESFMIYKL
jgi:hypothetical protein